MNKAQATITAVNRVRPLVPDATATRLEEESPGCSDMLAVSPLPPGAKSPAAINPATIRRRGPRAAAAARSPDGHILLVQSMHNRAIGVFRWDGHRLTPGQPLEIRGAGPETFATPWP